MQNLEEITKKYLTPDEPAPLAPTQPKTSRISTPISSVPGPSIGSSLVDDTFKRIELQFESQFGRPLRQTAGAEGHQGIHKRLYGGKAGDIGTHELSPEEGDWVVSQMQGAGLNVGDYRKNWRAIKGTGPHIHGDQPDDLMLVTAKYLDKD